MAVYSETSKTGMKNPVDKPGFWLKPENHFWNKDTYTQKAKEYFAEFLEKVKEQNKVKHGKPLNRNHM